MPSVGSTPTLTSPQQQHHPQSLPLQLKLQLQKQYKQQQQQKQLQQVTTTQPSPAGTYHVKSVATFGDTAGDFDDAEDDPSTMSSRNSFSSVDTNQTLLNSIATQTQQYLLPNGNKRAADSNNRAYRSKYSQFMIITPAVSIDRNFDGATGAAITDAVTDNDASHFNNGNSLFRMTLLQSSFDSGNSSDSSFCSNYNPNIHSSRYHLLPKAGPTFYTFSSWRWCTLICAAMRCFGAGANHRSFSEATTATYSTSLTRRPPYQRSCSSGIPGSSVPLRHFRSSSTSAEPFSSFISSKTCDHMNNVTYEL